MEKNNNRKKIFLCYSDNDLDSVQSFYAKLKAAGYSPWMNDYDILPGQEWELAIHEAMNKCQFIIVCLTDNFIKKRGHYNKELKLSLDILNEFPQNTIFVIPTKLEECETPENLSKFQVANLYENNGFNNLLKSIESDNINRKEIRDHYFNQVNENERDNHNNKSDFFI